MGRKATLRFKYMDQLMTISELMPFCKTTRSVLAQRLTSGWSIEKALTKKTEARSPKHEMSKNDVELEVSRSNKERKAKIHDVGPLPWLVGDLDLNRIPATKKTPIKSSHAKHAKNIETHCDSCGGVIWKSHANIRDYGHLSNKCIECRKKEKVEFNQAMINLAKRKGLIK